MIDTNINKTIYCSFIVTYKSGVVRKVNAYGGRTYDDAKQIAKEYIKKHPKVGSMEVYKYAFNVDKNTYLKNLING